ncbi:MAG: hypothetical protein QOF94_2608, partial [Acidobacteriaceae bacterium]
RAPSPANADAVTEPGVTARGDD